MLVDENLVETVERQGVAWSDAEEHDFLVPSVMVDCFALRKEFTFWRQPEIAEIEEKTVGCGKIAEFGSVQAGFRAFHLARFYQCGDKFFQVACIQGGLRHVIFPPDR